MRTPSLAITPRDETLRQAIWLGLCFAAVKVLFHLAVNLLQPRLGYEIFRDELYYLVCGRHLAWGYVDHGPVVAVQARLSELLFGSSQAGMRFLASFAGGIRLLLTGLTAWAMGGRRPVQAVAMLCVLCAPMYLGIDSFLSMNSWESMFWMTCILALLMLLRGASPAKWWLIFGTAAGVGLLNKPSMTFFLLSLLAGLLLTLARRVFRTRWAVIGITLLVLIALPNLLWQHANHWPTLEFLQNGKAVGKNIRLNPLVFALNQLFVMGLAGAMVWIGGLVWTLRRETTRWIGLTYIIFLVGMMALGAKDYYVSPIYPMLFAAGGVWLAERRSATQRVLEDRVFAFPTLAIVLAILTVIALPIALPILGPEASIRYMETLHLQPVPTESGPEAPLPQFFADRFGWQSEAEQVVKVYRSLSPEDQAKLTIYTSNYGEASAINIIARKIEPRLPEAISGHNNYFLWGPHGTTGDLAIAIDGSSLAHMHQFYSDVAVVGRMDPKYGMPYEHRDIYLARHRVRPLTMAEWESDLKHYI